MLATLPDHLRGDAAATADATEAAPLGPDRASTEGGDAALDAPEPVDGEWGAGLAAEAPFIARLVQRSVASSARAAAAAAGDSGGANRAESTGGAGAGTPASAADAPALVRRGALLSELAASALARRIREAAAEHSTTPAPAQRPPTRRTSGVAASDAADVRPSASAGGGNDERAAAAERRARSLRYLVARARERWVSAAVRHAAARWRLRAALRRARCGMVAEGTQMTPLPAPGEGEEGGRSASQALCVRASRQPRAHPCCRRLAVTLHPIRPLATSSATAPEQRRHGPCTRSLLTPRWVSPAPRSRAPAAAALTCRCIATTVAVDARAARARAPENAGGGGER